MEYLDTIWILICACFVFFMQAGFICYEVGFVQSKNVIAVAIENLLTFMVTSVAFCLVGFPLMFGATWQGLAGGSLWAFDGLTGGALSGFPFMFFETMFAATSVTIFAGSMSERTKTFPLQIAAVVSAAFIYPVFGHWAWGGMFLKQETWLSSMGYMDFAGASVVHTTAGFIALAGLVVVGKRRDPKQGRSNIPFAVLGVFILWFGWFGFNGGSLLAFDGRIGEVLLNTNLAAATGMIGALVANLLISRRGGYLISIFNGVLGGLAAITACSYYVEPGPALLIGLIAGACVDLASLLLERLGIDDAVGAVPVHLFGGIAGMLLMPFLMNEEYLRADGRSAQFLVQLFGLFVNFCWAFGISYAMFRIIDRTVGIRVAPEEEEKGLNIAEFSDIYSWEKHLEINSYQTEIEDKNALLRKQARLLAVTEEQEKTRLARDLHDGAGQTLAALKLTLGVMHKGARDGTASPEEILEGAERSAELADASMNEIRNVLNNLRPKALAERGLSGGLKAMASDLERTGAVRCTYGERDPMPPFDDTVALNIYRVIQEALTNVVKHSGAESAEITACAAGGGRYSFRITDDGCGMSGPPAGSGEGIPSMTDRVKMLGGTFRIDSAPGCGTEIIIEVPCDER
jgi:Amt family ammonium transporter